MKSEGVGVGEEWRSVHGYTGLYEVSDLGHLRRIMKTGTRMVRPQRKDKYGHQVAHLWKDGNHKAIAVHRLVAIAFLGFPPADKPEVRHLDGDASNNTPSNLGWGTHKQNGGDAARHGTLKRHARASGENHGCAKLSIAQVACIRTRCMSEPATRLAAEYGVTVRTIYSIKHRETWK